MNIEALSDFILNKSSDEFRHHFIAEFLARHSPEELRELADHIGFEEHDTDTAVS